MNVADTLRGKRILFVGATGFVGKVALSMLLRRYPDLDKVFVLVRPGAGSTSEQRFFGKVVSSPVFDPLREEHGGGLDAFLRARVVPLPGDAARPDLNFGPDDLARFGKVDAIINCAGLVSFSPSLETALRINTLGVRYVRELARKLGAGVVHISTCFVAGNRPEPYGGEVWEDDPSGYYPRKGELRDDDFQVDAEIADCERIIAQVKALADDRAHVSLFRERAAQRLREDGRDPDDDKNLKLTVARERKTWIAARLTELGMERARHWGWPNIYTYTKSLGDQVLATSDVPFALVRPSVVESAVRYPFAGWNEGFTTSAPLVYMALKGHRTFAAHPNANLDVVPVDLVASVIIGAAAAVIAGTQHKVYQAATSDVAPLPVPRAVELVGLFARRHWKDRQTGARFVNALRSRLEAVPTAKWRYDALSAPALKGVAQTMTRVIDAAVPRWGAPRLAGIASDLKVKLADVQELAGRTDDAFQLFMPFIHDNHYVFRADNTRALFASMSEADRQALPWDPETIEWRSYWLDLHLPGLKKWVFPSLDEEFRKKPRSVYTYKDLLELFAATTKLHRSRVALRQLAPVGSDEPVRRFTYRRLAEQVHRSAAALAELGVAPGDKVVLVGENRPEWGITFFAVLRAGGVVVPLDAGAGAVELGNVAAASHARLIVWSEKVRARLADAAILGRVPRVTVEELASSDCRLAPPAVSPRGDDLASLIFTSGTTGTPKGVMLSHKNFTSLLSKLQAVFDLKPHDRLLSVLPLHHTFEFTAGFLMPLMRGAQITYLHEVTPEDLEAAFDEGDVTGMIGVPALWQMLHRKIKKTVGEKGPWIEELFEAAVEGARSIRDKTGINVGKLLFWRVQRKLGGRMRLLVSGGSALPPEVMKAFQGLGFALFEGYGLTEAAPVLTVARPGQKVIPGSVGEALPGVEIRIDQPDASGVGEILASGPNVMVGYFEDAEATSEVLQDGWLRTGDLGKLDEERRLTIVGRKKEIILAANGENVYPDELEELYGDSPLVKELSIVGLPDEGAAGELVACLMVPATPEDRAACLEHVKEVSAKLPHFKRVKVLQLVDHELPRTTTRKVKRRLVVEELRRLSRAAAKGHAVATRVDQGAALRSAPRRAKTDGAPEGWLAELVAQVAQRPHADLRPDAGLDELGFDSLMLAELAAALDAAGVDVREEELASSAGTLGDLARLVESRRRRAPAPAASRKREENGDLHVPRPLVSLGRRLLTWGQRMTYERLFDVKVTGRAYLPKTAPFIVAANHASHLDMGLVKHALGDWGELLVALAAKDYFFEDRLKRAYFENFTNLVPMDRHGSLRESLRLAAEVLHQGRLLLIFPEGTRSASGVMEDFKPSIGYLALVNQVDVVPMYLEGTYDALPRGAVLPAERKIAAHIAPLVTHAALRKATAGLSRSEAYREAARIVEAAVRKAGGLAS
jgi:long-chain acyl-CoA synthetase